MLTYTSDYGLPWYMNIYWDGPYSFDKYWIIDETLTPSWDGEQFYFVERIENQYPYYYVYSYIRRMNTSNAASTNGCGSDEIHGFAHAPGENALLVSRSIESRTYSLELFDDYSLELLNSLTVDFECDGMLVLPYSGIALIHPLSSSTSIALDIETMEFVDTLSYAFSSGQVIEDFGAYIWGVSGGLRRVDLITHEVVAYGSGYPGHQQIIASSKGELCYISGNSFHRCDPFSLATLYTAALPSHEAAALVEAQDTVFAYLYTSLEPVTVYNTENLTSPGYVLYKEGSDDIEIFDMITLEEQEEIWCTCRDYYSDGDGAFSIAR